ncbi:hypothetical protein GGI43DRAFT_407976 [Trichoderma evansii]
MPPGEPHLRIHLTRSFRLSVLRGLAITVPYTLAAMPLAIFACKLILKSWNKSCTEALLNLDGT